MLHHAAAGLQLVMLEPVLQCAGRSLVTCSQPSLCLLFACCSSEQCTPPALALCFLNTLSQTIVCVSNMLFCADMIKLFRVNDVANEDNLS